MTIWLIDGAEQEARQYIDESDNKQLRAICDKTMHFLRGYYSNYSLELLSSVDYLLETVPALKNWRYDSAIAVLDVLEQEIQGWSKRKEQMFPRNLLINALEYIRYNANYKI